MPEIERQNWVIKERARGIMGAQVLDSNLICKVPFCAYAQVHDDNDITNTMKQRTTGGINLGPSNMRGEYRFLSLETGEILVRRKWTELPVLNDVIARVEEMSSSQDDDLEKILDDLNDSETEEEIQDQIEEIVRDEVDVDEDLNATEGCQANEESEGISYDDTIITDNLNDNENKEDTFRWKRQDLPLVPTSQSMDHPYSSRVQKIKTN